MLSVSHNGSRTDFAALAPFGLVTNSSYTVGDLTVHYRLGNFLPYVRIDNITDERYEEVVGFAAPRRRASAGLRIRLR